jgi:hypothetical protein
VKINVCNFLIAQLTIVSLIGAVRYLTHAGIRSHSDLLSIGGREFLNSEAFQQAGKR